MPAPAFASITDLRALLGKTRDTLSDDQARVILAAVSAAIRRECGWNLSRETVVGEVFHPRGRRSLFLPTLWLVSVDAVTEAGFALSTGYGFSRDGRVTRDAAFGWNAPVVISYTHGYDSNSRQYQDLATVCLSAAARVPGNPQGLRSWTVGGESSTAAGSGVDVTSILSAAERADLAQYRLDPIA